MPFASESDLEKFKEIVRESISIRECLQKMNLSATGGNYTIFYKRCQDYSVDTSHFLGKGYLKNKIHTWNPKRNYEDILVENSNYISTGNLKKRLLNDNLLINKCAICELEKEWVGKPIVLQLDHINGNRFDNRLENLRLLCPNCHSQTDTFAGRKLKKDTPPKIKKEKVIKFKSNKSEYKKHPDKFCPGCNKKIRYDSKKCMDCYVAAGRSCKIQWPSVEELKKQLETKPYTVLAKELGVSDNAIRKRIKNHTSS